MKNRNTKKMAWIMPATIIALVLAVIIYRFTMPFTSYWVDIIAIITGIILLVIFRKSK
jgi:glucose uptake protein GlcU